MYELPKFVYSRNGKRKGKPTGSMRPCNLEGCRGVRIGVRWSGGQWTFPCSDGLTPFKEGARIL